MKINTAYYQTKIVMRDRRPGISSSITQIIIIPARMPEPTRRPSMTEL